jgi:hypothetical protein
MSMIVLKVKSSLRRWAVLHKDVTVATFATRDEAEKAALAVATHHPPRDTAELDVEREDGRLSAMKVF